MCGNDVKYVNLIGDEMVEGPIREGQLTLLHTTLDNDLIQIRRSRMYDRHELTLFVSAIVRLCLFT